MDGRKCGFGEALGCGRRYVDFSSCIIKGSTNMMPKVFGCWYDCNWLTVIDAAEVRHPRETKLGPRTIDGSKLIRTRRRNFVTAA